MEKGGRVSPPIGRIVAVAAFGGLAVGVGALTPVGRVVLPIGAVVLALVTGIGFAVERHIRKKYPPVMFYREDVSKIKDMIESAGSRLAAGDSAAFPIHPIVDDSGDAAGQIWLFAAEDDVLEQVAIDLVLPDGFSLPSDLESLFREGWEIQSSQPQEWVVLTGPT